jgi:Helix-turn-helix domain
LDTQLNRHARRAAERFLREALASIVDDADIKEAIDKAVAAAIAEYLDTTNAAAFLDCSVEQLEIWRHKGEGPPYCTLGRRRIRYKREDLQRWMDATRVEPEAV